MFVHAFIAVVALGVTFAYPLMHVLAEPNGVTATRATLKLMHKLEDFFLIPGALLLCLLGVGLIFLGHDSAHYKDHFPAWLGIAIGWFGAAFAVAMLVQRPNLVKALRVLEGAPDGPTLPGEYVSVSRRMQIVGAALGLSILGITFLMVLRPGE